MADSVENEETTPLLTKTIVEDQTRTVTRFLPKANAGEPLLASEGTNCWRVVDASGRQLGVQYYKSKDAEDLDAGRFARFDVVVEGVDEGDWVRVELEEFEQVGQGADYGTGASRAQVVLDNEDEDEDIEDSSCGICCGGAKTAEKDVCRQCNGSGREPDGRICLNCDGHGKVIDWHQWLATGTQDELISGSIGKFFGFVISENIPQLAIIIFSAFTCWASGYAEVNAIDPLIFKTIFIIFGFTMGFRNVRANFRRHLFFDSLQNFMADLWSLYTSLPTESRKVVRKPLVNCVFYVLKHVELVTQTQRHWYAVLGLTPDFTRKDRERRRSLGTTTSLSISDLSEREPVPSPRILVTAVLMLCEAEAEKWDTKMNTQCLRRLVWGSRPQIQVSLDTLMGLCVPSVNSSYKAFSYLCIILFCLFSPWGVTADEWTIHLNKQNKVVISSLVLLTGRSVVICFVILSLDALTMLTEEPLNGIGRKFNGLGANKVKLAFDDSLKNYDKSRTADKRACGLEQLEKQMLAAGRNKEKGNELSPFMAQYAMGLVKHHETACMVHGEVRAQDIETASWHTLALGVAPVSPRGQKDEPCLGPTNV